MHDGEPGMLKPTLVAGLLFGLLASLPYLKVLNVCSCCSFVVLCGVVASYLYSKECARAGTEFGAGKGAAVGLIAGAVYGVSAAIFELGIVSAVGEPGLVRLLEIVRESRKTPPGTVEMIDEVLRQMDERTITVGSFVLSLFSSILTGALFSTVGGLIGGALFPTPPAPPVPPAASAGPGETTPDDPATRDRRA